MKTMRTTILTVLLSVAAAPSPAEEIAVHFDPRHTEVNFTLGDVLHTVHGLFRLKSGEMRFDAMTGKASGQLIVDAGSGNSGNSSRDGRMNRNILESKRYAEIEFTPERVDGRLNPDGDSDVQVHGVFTIHGTTHELVLPVRVHISGQQFTAATRFTVPYVKWGMKNPSTLFLRVRDQVQIDIQASGRITP